MVCVKENGGYREIFVNVAMYLHSILMTYCSHKRGESGIERADAKKITASASRLLSTAKEWWDGVSRVTG